MTMMATTITATNMFSENSMTVNFDDFFKSTPLVFYVFTVVAVMVCVLGIGPSGSIGRKYQIGMR